MNFITQSILVTALLINSLVLGIETSNIGPIKVIPKNIAEAIKKVHIEMYSQSEKKLIATSLVCLIAFLTAGIECYVGNNKCAIFSLLGGFASVKLFEVFMKERYTLFNKYYELNKELLAYFREVQKKDPAIDTAIS